MKYTDLKSEIARLAKVVMTELKECRGAPTVVSANKLEAIITRVETVLFPLADRINETNARRQMLEDLDRIYYAVEQFLEADLDEDLSGPIQEGIKMLSGVSVFGAMRFNQIVNEEITEARIGRTFKYLLKEEPVLQSGNIEKIANDSVDLALDSYFKQSSETLGLTGGANKERAEDGEGKQDFSVIDFATDVANLVERANELLDLDGTISRRAYNYVNENHGSDAAENFKQVIESNFQIFIDSQPDAEGERNFNNPAAVGAGAGSGGEAASGGGGQGGAP
jgi:hypothetical protein